jgi:hypothetical protein
MVSAGTWLSILAAVAGPTVVVASYARQQKKAAPVITESLIESQRRLPKYAARRPLRWYHILVITAVLALPFIQWFAFLRFQTRVSFLIPLTVTAGLMFVVGAFYPRFILSTAGNRKNQREAGLRVSVLAAALVIALILPSTGTIIVLRGALSDILALVCVGHLIRVLQSKGEAVDR